MAALAAPLFLDDSLVGGVEFDVGAQITDLDTLLFQDVVSQLRTGKRNAFVLTPLSKLMCLGFAFVMPDPAVVVPDPAVVMPDLIRHP